MNLKTKALGLVAGTALTLGLATGVMAADGNTTAILENNALGACSAAGAAGEINLGTWEWNGSAYDLESGNTGLDTITFGITQTVRPTPAVNCNVAVSVSDLVSGANTIPSNLIDVDVESGSLSTGSPYTVSTDADGTNLVLSATLTSVPTTIPQGTYIGTVTVTSATAAL